MFLFASTIGYLGFDQDSLNASDDEGEAGGELDASGIFSYLVFEIIPYHLLFFF